MEVIIKFLQEGLAANQIHIVLLVCLLLAAVIFYILKKDRDGGGVCDKFTLSITSFQTQCGLIRYNCFIPETGKRLSAIEPIGFKSSFDELLIEIYGLNVGYIYSFPADGVQTGSDTLCSALRSKIDCVVEIKLTKLIKVMVAVEFKETKPFIDLTCMALNKKVS